MVCTALLAVDSPDASQQPLGLVQAQQQAQKAAAQKMDAEATLTAANAILAEEGKMFARWCR